MKRINKSNVSEKQLHSNESVPSLAACPLNFGSSAHQRLVVELCLFYSFPVMNSDLIM